MKTKTKLWIILLFFYSLGIVALVASCNGQTPEPPQQQQEETIDSDVHLAALSESLISQQPTPIRPDTPVSVCLLVDFTGSMNRYPIHPPSAASLERLLFAISTVGGTFGYGSIADEPTDPLESIFFPPPEKRPDLESATNPFIRKKLQRQYEKELPGYQAREEDRRLSNQALIETYMPALREWVNRPPDAPLTDIWSSFKRCELRLMQDPAFWEEATGHVPKRIILAITDGEHSASHSSFAPIDKSIQVIVATGRKGAGHLERLRPPPKWFESAESAIRYLLTDIQRRN